MSVPTHGPGDQQASVGDLVSELSEQTSRLVRDELRLAQAELQQKGKHAGIGLGMFSGAGLFAFFGLAAVITAGILALALVVPGWAAALIVAAVLFVIAAVAGLLGKKEIEQAKPVPERTVATVKQDVEELKERGQR